MSRKLLHRVLKVLEDKRLRMDEHLIPIIVDEIKEELAKPEPVGKIPTLSEMKKLLNGEPI